MALIQKADAVYMPDSGGVHRVVHTVGSVCGVLMEQQWALLPTLRAGREITMVTN